MITIDGTTIEAMTIQELILSLREEYLVSGQAVSIRDINNGLCVQFAEEIEHQIPESEACSNDFYMVELDDGWNGDGKDQWDIELLNKANAFIPAPYTLDMVNKIRGYHRWVEYEGKHYDAEAPEGVVNFFDLPIFKVWLQNIYQEHKKTQRR